MATRESAGNHIKYEDKFARESLTFDDVLVLPAESNIVPRDAKVATKLTSKIVLNIPIMSAPMDTVTEARMAISMAREGGIGIIHKSLDPKDQAAEVTRVKRSEHGLITDPITCKPDDSVRQASALMARYKISGVPIIDDHSNLVGIITNRDLRFESNWERPIFEVMTSKRLVTAPAGTNLDEAKKILAEHKIEKLPLVDKNGVLKGLFTIKDIEKTRQYPSAAKDDRGRLLVGAAVGVTADVLDRVKALVHAEVDIVVVDSAHGHSANVIRSVEMIKARYPDLSVLAGNVATFEGARALCRAGADAIRVGIGPGSICTTRVVAGIGVPQLTAVFDASNAASEFNIPVVADGGIRYSGDIVKAIAAGAHVVMLGSVLAGTEESPGEMELYQGRSFKVYRGMGSIGAMKTGSPDRYFQEKGQKLVPEGIEGRVPYRGQLSETLYQLIGGLRSGMGYTGSATIEDLRTKTVFTRVTSSGVRENHPHDVQITREAPNYSAL